LRLPGVAGRPRPGPYEMGPRVLPRVGGGG